MPQTNKPLWQEIKSFSRKKYWIAALLILLGIPGLILPIIPGLLFIGIAVYIIKPEWFDRLMERFIKRSN